MNLGVELSPLIELRVAAQGRTGGTPGTKPLGSSAVQAGSFDLELAGRF